jgi:hypothetical protein
MERERRHPQTTVSSWMTLNTGWVEHKGGNFLFYSEGLTAGVANTIENADKERLAIVQKRELKKRHSQSSFISMVFLLIHILQSIRQYNQVTLSRLVLR